jgi:hypothetical protein
MGVEHSVPPLLPLLVVIVPSEQVWRHVVEFSDCRRRGNHFQTGRLSRPRRIYGVGVVHCRFSTGPFVEPIEVWDELRLLKLVTKKPGVYGNGRCIVRFTRRISTVIWNRAPVPLRLVPCRRTLLKGMTCFISTGLRRIGNSGRTHHPHHSFAGAESRQTTFGKERRVNGRIIAGGNGLSDTARELVHAPRHDVVVDAPQRRIGQQWFGTDALPESGPRNSSARRGRQFAGRSVNCRFTNGIERDHGISVNATALGYYRALLTAACGERQHRHSYKHSLDRPMDEPDRRPPKRRNAFSIEVARAWEPRAR